MKNISPGFLSELLGKAFVSEAYPEAISIDGAEVDKFTATINLIDGTKLVLDGIKPKEVLSVVKDQLLNKLLRDVRDRVVNVNDGPIEDQCKARDDECLDAVNKVSVSISLDGLSRLSDSVFEQVVGLNADLNEETNQRILKATKDSDRYVEFKLGEFKI